MRVLVTGATGFIGQHLSSRLVELGFDVYALERYVTGRYVLGEMRHIKTVFGDLREYFTIRNIVRDVQPEAVIHLGSVSPVSYSYSHPQEVLETNFNGTVNLAEACLREISHFKHFLFASTSETYGRGPVPKSEETPQIPNSPYSVSKLAGEKYLLYLKDAYNFPLTILRNFNTYGRKDNTHFVVERTIVQMLKGNDVALGDPTPLRDFEYVDDHVNSYLTCLTNENALGEVFNFCTGKAISIRQLVEQIRELTNFRGEITWNSIPARPLDIPKLYGDYSKAKKLLNWEPKYTLEKGLKLCVKHWAQKLDLKTFA